MEKLSELGVSLVDKINDTHKKGLEFEKKSVDNRIFSLKEFKKSGGFLDELKIECISLGINFIDTQKEKTDISEKSSQRYRKLFTDKRLSLLIENENGDKLKGINNLGLMKLIDMSKLSDEDFETVVSGDDTPLSKNKVTPPTTDESEKDKDTSDNSDDTDENGNDNPPPLSVPTEFIDTLGKEYFTLIDNDKKHLILRISDEIVEKQKLEKEIIELKKQLDNLSPQREV